MGWKIGRKPGALRFLAFAMLASVAIEAARADIPVPGPGPQVQNPREMIETLGKKIQSGSLAGKELADAYFGLCQAYGQLRRIDVAVTACSKSIDTADSTGARVTRGVLYAGLKNYPAALDDFAALERLNPKDPSGHALSAVIYWMTGNIEKYASESDAAMALVPDSGPALKSRAELYFNNGYWSLALADYESLLKRQPDDAAILHFRGDAKTYLGDYEGGMHDYDQALKLDPKEQLAPVARAKAMSFFDQGKFDDAVEQAKIAADSVPDNAYYLLWLDLTRRHAGKSDAGDFAKRAASLNQTAWPYSIVAFELGSMKEGELLLAAENGANPAQISGQKCEADFYLGEYKLNGDKTAAINFLKQAVGGCPKGFIEANGAAFELRALGENVKF